MNVQVIIPTIIGRETVCERTVAAYKQQDAEVLLVTGASTCGEGWAAGLEKADADFIILSADDSVPHPGAIEAGRTAAMHGIYPSPRVVLEDDSLESCGSLGGGGCHLPECPDGTLAYMASYPIATREAWEKIGAPLPIHYYIDDYLGYRARCIGLKCEVVRDYAFTHYDEKVGRQRVINQTMADRAKFIEALV